MKYIFLLLCVAIVMASGCSKPQRGAPLDEAFRSAIPPDTQSMFGARLDKLKTCDFYRRHQNELNLPVFDEAAQRTGLDVRRDLSTVLVIWDGKHLLFLAKGRLSDMQVEEKMLSGGAQRAAYKNFTLFTHGGDSVVFPESGLAMAAPTEVLQATLDLRSGRLGRVPSELEDRLAEVPSDAQIWVVSRGGLPTANLPLRSDIESALSNITMAVSGTSLGVRADAGLHVQARILCKSPEGAQRVNDTLRGLIGLARLSTKDNELDLLRMWDAVSITKEQEAVRIQADLAADLTDKLIAQLSTFRGRAGGALNPR